MTRLVIFDNESFGLSPANKSFSINWVGKFSSATLTVNFGTSFGYGLQPATLNGVSIPITNDGLITADVSNLLVQGSNKLGINFNDLQLLGKPLGQAVISAYIDYFGASVLQTPSVTQFFTNIETGIKNNLPAAIAIIIGGAVALGSIAYVASRLPSAGNMKLSDVPKSVGHLANSAKESFSKSASHLHHAIMKIGVTN